MEDIMLEKYFEMPMRLRQLRGSPLGNYLDEFAEWLEDRGYAPRTAHIYVVAAEHLGIWLESEGRVIADLDEKWLALFAAHFPCKCRNGHLGKSKDIVTGPRRFLEYLRIQGTARPQVQPLSAAARFTSIADFQRWMINHRGVSKSTIKAYDLVLVDLLNDLGEDTTVFTAVDLRNFVLSRARRHGISKAKLVVTAIRMFLRFLVVHGRCDETLVDIVPTIPNRRLVDLPRALSTEDVNRIIDACATNTTTGLRDRAVILLLARLGLRAGDVADLSFSDIEWDNAGIRVCGKGRREIRLPLPQDVGDAILAYLEKARPAASTDRIFYTSRAPLRPLRSRTISAIVRTAMARTDVVSPCRGAHVLRHSAATAMLGAGASLQAIGAVLRHRSVETTNRYAKVDVVLLQQIAQPWPVEVTSC
jgi:site-specific recombinase XerD